MPPLAHPALWPTFLALSASDLLGLFPRDRTGAALFFAVWLLVGYAVVVAFNRHLLRRARASDSKIDDIVVDALRRPVYVWVLLLGLYAEAVYFQVVPPAWVPGLALVIPVLLALTVPFALVQVVVGLLGEHAQRRPEFRAVRGTVEFAVRLVVYTVSLLLVLDYLGVEITPLLAAFGIGGLAMALALQETLANFFAGMYLTLDRPLRDGDYVELEGGGLGTVKGYVVDMSWRSVRIRELQNNIIVLPNSKVATGVIKNYDLPEPEMAALVQVSVAYNSDLERVERVTCEVAKEVLQKVSGGVASFEPFIRYHTFGDHGIGYTVILRVRTFVDQYLVTHEFIKALHNRFRQEGIEIPFPQRTLHFAAPPGGNGHDGEAPGGPPGAVAAALLGRGPRGGA